MAATLAHAVWFLCVYLLGNVKPVDSMAPHFTGGIIRWRPVNPAAFDGRVQITHRIAWRKDIGAGGICTQATIDAQTLVPSGGRLTCQSGCSGIIIGNLSYYCTDFSVTDNWSAGERTYYYTYNFTAPSFEAVALVFGISFLWEFRVRGNLTYREDTGLVNSSPVVNVLPLVRIQQGCNHTIKVSVGDADGDHVRCRWAESSLNECGGVCRQFPATLKGRECEIEYIGSSLVPGDYAVALQVEDFSSPTDTISLSSVPVQFVVRVQEIPSSPCTVQPQFVGPTPFDGACISVPSNTSWNATIIARVSNSAMATSILEIVTISPLGVSKSELFRSDYYPREWQVNITWTPLESQFGPNIFCFAAVDDAGLQSDQRCITLFVGVSTILEPPMIVPDSMSPMGEILSNQGLWSVQFNKKFTRPTRDSFIRIFGQKENEMFLSINAKTSSAVTYPGPSDTFGRTLTFNINSCQLPFNQTFYVLFDPGVAVGTDSFCHAESPPLTDPTLWTFAFVEQRDTQGQSDTHKQEKNILITGTLCTILAFIVGVISALIAYHCVSVLLKRKADHERKSAASLNIEQSGNLQRIHYENSNVNIEAEASDIYDEIVPQGSIPGTSDMEMSLDENVAYGQL